MSVFIPDPTKSLRENRQDLQRARAAEATNPKPPTTRKPTDAERRRLGELKSMLTYIGDAVLSNEKKNTTYRDLRESGRAEERRLSREGDPTDDSIVQKFVLVSARNLLLVNWLGGEAERRNSLTEQANAAFTELAALHAALFPSAPAWFKNPGHPLDARIGMAIAAISEWQALK
jgi:hypothetical protein